MNREVPKYFSISLSFDFQNIQALEGWPTVNYLCTICDIFDSSSLPTGLSISSPEKSYSSPENPKKKNSRKKSTNDKTALFRPEPTQVAVITSNHCLDFSLHFRSFVTTFLFGIKQVLYSYKIITQFVFNC